MERLSAITFLLLSCLAVFSVAENTTAAPTTTWTVKDGTNVCIVAAFDANFTVSYKATNPKTNDTYTRNATFDIPRNAVVDSLRSFCLAGVTRNYQGLALQWGVYKYNVTLSFSNDNMNKTIVDWVSLQYDLGDAATFVEASVTNSSIQTVTSMGGPFATINDKSYLECSSGISVLLKTSNAGEQNYTTSAIFSNVKLQAFRNSTNSTFNGNAEICPGDQVTTTFAPATTTSAPANVANYTLVDANGHVCLIAIFDLSVAVKYQQNVTTNVTRDEAVTISGINNGTVNQRLSTCNENATYLVIDGLLPDWQLSLNFTNSSGKFYLQQVMLHFNLRNSSKITNATYPGPQNTTTTGLKKWQAALGHSYKCARQDTWNLNTTGINGVAELSILLDNIQVQAFMNNSTGSNFGQAEDCVSSTSDIVPIAVGCALAALVVIVLIAYVIGRRRNRSRGYESM